MTNKNPFQSVKPVPSVLPSRRGTRYGTRHGSRYALQKSYIVHRKSYFKTKRRSGIGSTAHTTPFSIYHLSFIIYPPYHLPFGINPELHPKLQDRGIALAIKGVELRGRIEAAGDEDAALNDFFSISKIKKILIPSPLFASLLQFFQFLFKIRLIHFRSKAGLVEVFGAGEHI